MVGLQEGAAIAISYESLNRVLIGIISAGLGTAGYFIKRVYDSIDHRITSLEEWKDSIKYGLGGPDRRKHSREE